MVTFHSVDLQVREKQEGRKKELVTCKAEHKPVCGLCSHMIHDSCQSRNSVSICCWRYFVEFTLFVVQ